MPASQVAKKFRAGKLHSGSKQGPIVTNPAQAKAIQISEARSEGYNIPVKKGKKVARHTIKGNRGAEKPKPGSGMAYSKGSSIFGVPKDIANKDGYSPAGHENRGHNKSLKGKGGHPGEGHKGHAPGNANAYRDGHGGTLDVQKHTHDGFGEKGHTKRHHFSKIGHRNHASKMSVG